MFKKTGTTVPPCLTDPREAINSRHRSRRCLPLAWPAATRWPTG